MLENEWTPPQLACLKKHFPFLFAAFQMGNSLFSCQRMDAQAAWLANDAVITPSR